MGTLPFDFRVAAFLFFSGGSSHVHGGSTAQPVQLHLFSHVPGDFFLLCRTDKIKRKQHLKSVCLVKHCGLPLLAVEWEFKFVRITRSKRGRSY